MADTSESWQEQDYPDRYYAYPNTSILLGGYPVVWWVDVAIFTTKPAWLPAASDMLALSEEEWNSKSQIDQIIKDGKVQTYVAPVSTETGTSSTMTAGTS